MSSTSLSVMNQLLVVFVVGFAFLGRAFGDEEAPYDVVHTYKDFEVRRYESQKWLCNKVQEDKYGVTDNLRQFNRLRSYKDNKGDNVPMTIPVSMKKTTENGKAYYEMCLYIPTKYQKNTPVPSQPNVHILEVPERLIYAKHYSGWVLTEKQWSTKADDFKNILKEAKQTGDIIDFSFYYGCGFSSPTKFWGRRNEVWFVKKEKTDPVVIETNKLPSILPF